MAITAGQEIVASDFVDTPSGAGDSGKVGKLDTGGKINNGLLITDLIQAGETIDGTPTPVPVAVLNDVHQREYRTEFAHGDAAARTRLAVKMKPYAAITAADIRLILQKVGSPTGNLTIEVQTDSAGSPSGTPVTNGTSNTVAMSGLSTSYTETTFTFASAFSLSADTVYWIVLKRSDAVSGANYVNVLGIGNDYANFVGKTFDGVSTWSSGNLMAVEMVPTTGGSNSAWRSDANVIGLHWFDGFAISDAAESADVIVQFAGVVSGFTALRRGRKYFAQDTVGTLGLTVGTYEVGVGEAISETELLIKRYSDEYIGSTTPVRVSSVATAIAISGANSWGANYSFTTTSTAIGTLKGNGGRFKGFNELRGWGDYYNANSFTVDGVATAYTLVITATTGLTINGGSGTAYFYR